MKTPQFQALGPDREISIGEEFPMLLGEAEVLVKLIGIWTDGSKLLIQRQDDGRLIEISFQPPPEVI
jgi:hypothetical protein